jgi:hypothetical protein
MSRYLRNFGLAIIVFGCGAIGTAGAFTSIASKAEPDAIVTRIDFDRVFADVEAAQRGNTAVNREKLRDLGWKRLMAPTAAKSSIPA